MAATRAHAVRAAALLLALAITAQALANDLPPLTADEVLARNIAALGGEENIRKIHTSIRHSQFAEGGAVVETFVTYRKAPNKFLKVRKAPDKEIREGYDGQAGWTQTNEEKPRLLAGDELRDFERRAEFYDTLALRGRHSIRYERRQRSPAGDWHVLRFADPSGQVCDRYYDAATFLEQRFECPILDGSVVTVTTLEDYRPVEGVVMSFRQVTELRSATGVAISAVPAVTWTMTRFVANEPLEDSLFSPPEEATKK